MGSGKRTPIPRCACRFHISTCWRTWLPVCIGQSDFTITGGLLSYKFQDGTELCVTHRAEPTGPPFELAPCDYESEGGFFPPLANGRLFHKGRAQSGQPDSCLEPSDKTTRQRNDPDEFALSYGECQDRTSKERDWTVSSTSSATWTISSTLNQNGDCGCPSQSQLENGFPWPDRVSGCPSQSEMVIT